MQTFGVVPRRDIGDHIVIDLPVIRIEPEIYGNIGVQRLKVLDGLLVDIGLPFIGIVFCPEGDLIIRFGVKFRGD